MTTNRLARPELECLEAREVPAVVFASYAGDGTWAYKPDTGHWRKISDYNPVAMDESSDGQLFASYQGNAGLAGTWLYNYASNSWSKIQTSVANVLSAPDQAGVVFGSFSTGTFRFKGNVWTEMDDAQATKLAAVDDNHFYGVYATGTWEWEGGDWDKLLSDKAIAIDAVADGTLFASFTDGTWTYDDGDWDLLNGAVATIIDAVSDDEVYWTGATGTWHSDDGDLYKLTNHQASALTYDAAGLIASFIGLSGTWEHVDGLDWDKFEGSKAALLAR